MRLVAFSIKNYRSIQKTPRLAVDPTLTVLIGPNNEGKSNLLRGFATAMQILSLFKFETAVAAVGAKKGKPRAELEYRRFGRSIYDWDSDFPVAKQESHPEGESVFAIEFELADEETEQFRSYVGSNLNGSLPVEVRVSKYRASLRVLKQGRGAATLAKKASKIASFIGSRLRFQHIEAVRSAEQARAVVSELVSEQLAVLEKNDEYRQALATIASLQSPILESISTAILDNLSSFLPDVTAVKVSIPEQRRVRALRRETEITVDDGTATSLEQKGDGVQSLAAISLLRHRVTALPGEHDLVLAIEEPESHIHPSAMRRLKQVLNEIASEHQLMISTHNAVFVERSRVASNIIVEKQQARAAKTIEEIRQSLGVEVHDNLQSSEIVLVVEGEDDRIAMRSLIAAASPQLADALQSNRLGIDVLGGGTNLGYKLSTLQCSLCDVHVLLDDDETGREALQKAIDGKLIDVSNATLTTCEGMVNAELEDWFQRDVYEQYLLQDFGITIASNRFRHNRDKWSNRLADVFAAAGKPWDKHLEARIKEEIAQKVALRGSEAIIPARREPFDALIASLERLLA